MSRSRSYQRSRRNWTSKYERRARRNRAIEVRHPLKERWREPIPPPYPKIAPEAMEIALCALTPLDPYAPYIRHRLGGYTDHMTDEQIDGMMRRIWDDDYDSRPSGRRKPCW